MSRVIYKYKHNWKCGLYFHVPYLIMDVKFQGDELYVWVMIDKEYQKPQEDFDVKDGPPTVVVLATGEEVDNKFIKMYSHHKTIHDRGVWHVFTLGGV